MASSNSVNIIDVCKVAPAHYSTESATDIITLPLSFFEMSSLRFAPTQSLYFFKLKDESTPTGFFHSGILPKLKHSLSHVLLHFIPVAGSLTWPPNTLKPIFVCHPNDTVSLTVAESANGDFDGLIGNGIRAAVDFHAYVPKLLATDTRAALLALQITWFPNKGFCMGISTHHVMFDAKSASMFLTAWAYACKHMIENGKIAHSLPEEITPSFNWATIKDLEGLEAMYLNFWENMKTPDLDLDSKSNGRCRSLKPLPCAEVPPNRLRSTFYLAREDIEKLRESVLRYHQDTKRLKLSTFVLACSYVLACLVKTRGGDTNRDVYFLFAADCRHRLDPPLPPNHFGNCIITHYIVAKAGEFMQENGVAVIAEKLTNKIKSLEKGVFEGSKEPLEMLRSLGPEVQRLIVAGATKLGFYNLDFGWGKVEKVHMASIDAFEGPFSMLDIQDGSGRTEISVVLMRPEMEYFTSLFADGLKVIYSKPQ